MWLWVGPLISYRSRFTRCAPVSLEDFAGPFAEVKNLQWRSVVPHPLPQLLALTNFSFKGLFVDDDTVRLPGVINADEMACHIVSDRVYLALQRVTPAAGPGGPENDSITRIDLYVVDF